MRVSSRLILELAWLKSCEQEVEISVFLSVLKVCSILTDLESGRRVHYDALQRGFHTNIYVSNTLINMYAKCGSMEEAGKVFLEMHFHNVVSWNALLLGYVENGDENITLSLFSRMQEEKKCVPDSRTYASVAKACGALAAKEPVKNVDGTSLKLSALEKGRRLYSQAAKLGDTDIFLASSFIDMFSKCGSMKESRQVFERLVRRDIVCWNTLILGYAENGEESVALELISCMGREDGCPPNARSFVAGLKACSSLAVKEQGRKADGKVVKVDALRKGMSLHSQALESGCELETYVSAALVEMYSKCGSLHHARLVFEKLEYYNPVPWNSLMLGYVENEEEAEALKLFMLMRSRGHRPDARSYVAALKACSGLAMREKNGKPLRASLEKGRHIHSLAAEDGYVKDIFVASTLVDMYSRCRSMSDAQKVFDGMKVRNVVSWTALILGYVENQHEAAALEVFTRMKTEEGCEPNVLTFLAVIKACSGLAAKEEAREVDGRVIKQEALRAGVEVHQQAKERHLDSDVFLSSALVEMYSRCGSLPDSKAVFDRLPHQDLVSWNALLSAYVENGEEQQALELFRCMNRQPDARTYLSVFKACSGLAAKDDSGEFLKKAAALHAEASKSGFETDSYVSTSLVDMYSKLGKVAEARNVYNKTPAKTPALWTALVLGYLENSEEDSVPQLLETFPPGADALSFSAAIRSCAALALKEIPTEVDGKPVKARWLEKGTSLHSQAASGGLDSDTFVAAALVDMYTKCGSLVDARRVFERTRTVVAWNVLMLGYVKGGEPGLAVELFESMQREGLCPDSRSYAAAVKACSVLASGEKGEMVDGEVYKLTCLEKAMEFEARSVSCSDAHLAASLIELYGRCRSVRDCYRVVERTCSWNVFMLNSLMLGFLENGEEELVLELFTLTRKEEKLPLDAQTVVYGLKACIGLAAENEALKVRSLEKGKELHDFVAETGLDSSPFVAATLVSMYCKCGSWQEASELFNASKLLQNDVVSWNCLILGLAEGGEEQQAFEAFSCMKTRGCQPDEGTYVAVLKACGSAASVELTREVSGEIERRLGGAKHQQLANALLDAFGKCGSMSEAQHVFDSLATTDLVSWNSLLAGYSHRGEAALVLSLFREMQAHRVKVNGISLVSVLTACSHAGLVEKAREYFENLNLKFGVSPGLEHYHCMIDALGRSNQVKAAVDLVNEMVVEPNAVTWFTVLAACHKWKNVEVGEFAFECLVKMDNGVGDTPAAYVLMSNILK